MLGQLALRKALRGESHHLGINMNSLRKAVQFRETSATETSNRERWIFGNIRNDLCRFSVEFANNLCRMLKCSSSWLLTSLFDTNKHSLKIEVNLLLQQFVLVKLPSRLHQLLVRPRFNTRSVLQHHNPVRIPDRR
jgi:hypothetical protein